MDKINFNQTGGFPLTTDVLNAMQNAYDVFNSLGSITGNLTIISGCEQVGSNVSSGVVYINGELLPFKGGVKQDKVIIVESETSYQFEDGSTKDVLFERTAQFGVGTNSISWADFKRYYPYQAIHKEIKWVGRDVTQQELPSNWYIADGQNGTDNLLGRMLVGKDPNQTEFKTIGKTGGAKTHQLTINEMPKHDHKQGSESLYNLFGGGEYVGKRTYPLGDHDMYIKQDTSEQGGDAPHNNLPPYFVAKPIQFIKPR